REELAPVQPPLRGSELHVVDRDGGRVDDLGIDWNILRALLANQDVEPGGLEQRREPRCPEVGAADLRAEPGGQESERTHSVAADPDEPEPAAGELSARQARSTLPRSRRPRPAARRPASARTWPRGVPGRPATRE